MGGLLFKGLVLDKNIPSGQVFIPIIKDSTFQNPSPSAGEPGASHTRSKASPLTHRPARERRVSLWRPTGTKPAAAAQLLSTQPPTGAPGVQRGPESPGNSQEETQGDIVNTALPCFVFTQICFSSRSTDGAQATRTPPRGPARYSLWRSSHPLFTNAIAHLRERDRQGQDCPREQEGHLYAHHTLTPNSWESPHQQPPPQLQDTTGHLLIQPDADPHPLESASEPWAHTSPPASVSPHPRSSRTLSCGATQQVPGGSCW